MIVEFDKSFSKYLQKIKDSSILLKTEKAIVLLEEAKSLTAVPQCKKMSGYKRITGLESVNIGWDLKKPVTTLLG